MRAFDEDDGARAMPQIARISADVVPVDDRAALLTDELGKRLTSGHARVLSSEAPPELHWLNVDLGDGLVLADVRVGGLDVQRTAAMARAGDDDCSLFLPLTDGVLFEQNDRRSRLASGDAVFVAHSRAVRSWYHGRQHVLVVRMSRPSLEPHLPVERAGGQRVDALREETDLLRAYVSALVRRSVAGHAPSALARRHVTELVAAAVGAAAEHEGADRQQARTAARLERMLEHVAARFAVASLSMGDVAGSVGLSARAGYLAFAAAGLDFTKHLQGVRLDHARERLERGHSSGARIADVAFAVGFGDVSHFNRLFRQRFGCAPGEFRRQALASAAAAR